MRAATLVFQIDPEPFVQPPIVCRPCNTTGDDDAVKTMGEPLVPECAGLIVSG